MYGVFFVFLGRLKLIIAKLILTGERLTAAKLQALSPFLVLTVTSQN